MLLWRYVIISGSVVYTSLRDSYSFFSPEKLAPDACPAAKNRKRFNPAKSNTLAVLALHEKGGNMWPEFLEEEDPSQNRGVNWGAHPSQNIQASFFQFTVLNATSDSVIARFTLRNFWKWHKDDNYLLKLTLYTCHLTVIDINLETLCNNFAGDIFEENTYHPLLCLYSRCNQETFGDDLNLSRWMEEYQ